MAFMVRSRMDVTTVMTMVSDMSMDNRYQILLSIRVPV